MIPQKLKYFFLKDPAKPLFWILFGVLVKGLPLLFLLHNRPPSDMPGIWGATMDDTHTYLDPIEDFLKTGTYSPGYHMPGYGFTYLFLRLIFSQAIACNILIVLQFLLAGISVYYLALTAKTIFQSDPLFYLCFYLFLFSTYSNYYDGWLLTESFCCSALIFSVWFFVKYFSSGLVKSLLLSGLFLTWAIFLRPVFMPLTLVFLLVLIFQSPFRGLGLKSLLIFILPFILIEGGWMTFNYSKYQKIIPFTSRNIHYYKQDTTYEKPLFEFIRSWGGSADFTDNNSYLFWFGFHLKDTPIPKNYSSQLPDNIYTSEYNKDSLVQLKRMITALNDSALSPGQAHLYQKQLKEKLTTYTLSVKAENPLVYYLEAPLFHCVPQFLFGAESKIYLQRFNLPGKLGFISVGFFTLVYSLLVILGTIGACILLFKGLGKNKLLLIIAIIPLYTIIVHSLILRFTYNRYLMPAYAFLIVCSAYVMLNLFQHRKR